jgi:7-cyano-7-deazaguanine reductase
MSIAHTLLGHPVPYPSHYNPELLLAIPRAHSRCALQLAESLPFTGADIWNAYELSWLDTQGKPQVAMATFTVPADTPNLIESKSFKLYLNSYNQTRLANADTVRRRMVADLSAVAGKPIAVDLILPEHFARQPIAELEGTYIDDLDVAIDTYQPDRALLHCAMGEPVSETLCSRLLKSNCPVTLQPDWACIQIRYRGAPIDHPALLRYLVSFRQHAEFHEHCVERIYMDILHACQPQELTVYARYTRRGGLDINPWRSNGGHAPTVNVRTARQ